MDEHDVVQSVANSLKRSVLATIISVEGHAYKKEGAMMQLFEDGSTVGSISPGCIEADLRERVPLVLETKRFQTVRYDTQADDWLWGKSVGCGGIITVLLEYVSPELGEYFKEIKRRLEKREDVLLRRTFQTEGQRIQYQVARADKCYPLVNHCLHRQLFRSKPRLLIFGAEQDAQRVADLAAKVGFHVIVSDWRGGLCTAKRFPLADVVVGNAPDILDYVCLDQRDYVILMSHQLERDRAFLQAIANTELKYLGIMGSPVRVKQLLEGFADPGRVHSPVGLQIGAMGEEEIAVSIVAELIQERRLSGVSCFT